MSVINLSEQDFSLCVDYDLPQQDLHNVRKFNQLLIVALLVSLLFHLLFFLLKPFWYSPEVPVSRSIAITLQKIEELPTKELPIHTPEIIETIPIDNTNEIVSKIPQKSTETEPQIISSQSMSNSVVSKPLELLSTEDYADLRQNNVERNNTDSLAFNPHLKQQLQKTRQVTNQRGKKSISWQDAGGSLYYKVGGQCFMSPPQNATSSVREGKNWYMVSCPGKSESEKMIDNVNREMKERFKQ